MPLNGYFGHGPNYGRFTVASWAVEYGERVPPYGIKEAGPYYPLQTQNVHRIGK